MIYAELRQAVCACAVRMWEDGLVVGSAGNVSARATGGHFVITPSSISYRDLTPEQVVVVDEEGDLLELDDEEFGRAPSFETPVHLAVYAARPDVHAVVHTHSRFASALALARRGIPAAMDEMVVHLGGPIEVADHAPSGSDELASNVVSALGPRAAVLMAAHGVLTCGKHLEKALQNAQLVEHIAHITITAERLLGASPAELPEETLIAERSMYEVVKEL